MPDFNVELRVPYAQGHELREILFNSTRENVVIGEIGGATLSGSYILLLNSFTQIPQNQLRYGPNGVSWSASFNAQMIDEAAKHRLGLLVLHSHPSNSMPALSPTDRRSGKELCQAFKTAIPKLPHGTAVLGGDYSVSGLAWIPGRSEPVSISRIRWISDPLTILPEPKVEGYRPETRYSRQKLLIGEKGQELLAASKVGVVGLGGGGSHVVQQLAMLGVGTVVMIDNDVIDETNLHRTVGARPEDVKQLLHKTEIMNRLISEIGSKTKVIAVAERFPSDGSTRALKECDIIVGCLDKLLPRKELQSFCWRYLIPYVDIGLMIEMNENGSEEQQTPRRISGQVYDLLPGAACLWCAQIITEAKLLAESGGRGPTYIQRSDERAQVVSLNGVLASQAVSEVLHIITGYAKRKHVPNALQFDGITGTLSPCLLERKTGCHVCSNELGYGDSVW